MTVETVPWDIQDHIGTLERQLGYLEAAFEDGDPHLIAAAVEDIARARGLIDLVGPVGSALEPGSQADDPRLSTLMTVVKALGLQLRIAPLRAPETV